MEPMSKADLFAALRTPGLLLALKYNPEAEEFILYARVTEGLARELFIPELLDAMAAHRGALARALRSHSVALCAEPDHRPRWNKLSCMECARERAAVVLSDEPDAVAYI
jgi:hypothetical protein